MGRENWHSRSDHLGCSAWWVQVENTKVSSPVCSLSSKGEGKPLPRALDGSKKQRSWVGVKPAPCMGAVGRGWGEGSWGAGWHWALPGSQSGGGGSPGCEGSVPCRPTPPTSVPPLLAAVPGLRSAQAQREIAPDSAAGAQGRAKGAGVPSRS